MIQSNLYQVFIRNHSEQGTIKEVTKDLERIKNMGFDIIYLMPFHPISFKNRKGTYGSPYAIADYYGVSEDLGTMEDLEELIDTAHDLKLKVIMDIVFNHTGRDHTYITSNPEFYVLDENGQPTARVADWYDIADFNFENKGLYKELMNVLMFWAHKKIDGVRCDVASLIPLDFWQQARELVNGVYSDFMWFSESVDHGFLRHLRKENHLVNSDIDILSVFDGSYDYDLWNVFNKVLKKEESIDLYCALFNYQTASLPKGKVKWRFIENHDQPRSMAVLKNRELERLWLSFVLLIPGIGFLYAGQESYQEETTPLFEKEKINTNYNLELVSMITRLNLLKKEMYKDGVLSYDIQHKDGVLTAEINTVDKNYFLVLNLSLAEKEYHLDCDICYNLMDGSKNKINNGKITLGNDPLLII